jgi:NADPH:quinone reductase-like Zn-dependent oxidoreductase
VLVGHRDALEAMNRAIETHAMRPVIDRVFPFSAAREAFEYMSAGRHLGKICVRF